MNPQVKHIVLGVTGSIAAYKAADIVRCLKKKGCRVSVIMTRSAQEFITPLTMAILSEEKVWRSMFEDEAQERMLNHLCLAQAADVFVIAPATANVIGKVANGIADDLLTAVAMATRAPVIVAPAMNDKMWTNPRVQENCKKLQSQGVIFVGPKEGGLACGVYGPGHIADVDEIVNEIEKLTRNA
ncbi:MAG: flavoprotein [Candidatus Omnitrophota bacterium]